MTYSSSLTSLQDFAPASTLSKQKSILLVRPSFIVIGITDAMFKASGLHGLIPSAPLHCPQLSRTGLFDKQKLIHLKILSEERNCPERLFCGIDFYRNVNLINPTKFDANAAF